MNQRNAGEEGSEPVSGGDAMQVGGVSRWLIRHAASASPPELSERLEEEWLADLGARSSTVSRVRFVLGCLWATRVISRDYAIARLPVAEPVFAPGVLPMEARPNANRISRRTTIFALVAVLHVALFYFLVTGLSSSLIKTNTPPLQNRVLNESHSRDLPSLPPPNLNPVKLDMPRLDEDIAFPSDDAQETIRADEVTVPGPPQTSTSPVTPPHVAKLSQGGPGVGFPSPDDFYPSISRHLEEQGVATVQVCVDAAGRLSSAPTVVTSSGSARLDEGALKLARAGSGHYRASTEDGRPIASCYPLRIRFEIRN